MIIVEEVLSNCESVTSGSCKTSEQLQHVLYTWVTVVLIANVLFILVRCFSFFTVAILFDLQRFLYINI